MLDRNPFFGRGPIGHPDQFHDREDTLRRIAQCLEVGPGCQLCGEHRTGRTSLLRYLADPAGVARGAGIGPDATSAEAYVWVLVEFGGLPELAPAAAPTASLLALWRFIADAFDAALQRLGYEGLRVAAPSAADPASADLDLRGKVKERIAGLDRQVVFLLDDFDIVVARLEIDPLERFQQGLRDLIIMPVRPALLVTSSVDSLDRLFRRKYAEANLPPQLSPLASVLTYVPMGLLDEAGALALIRGEGRAPDGPRTGFSPADEAFLLRLAGHHPHLLQVACYWLYEVRDEPDAHTATRMQVAADRQVQHLLEYLWRRTVTMDERQSSSELVGDNLAAALRALARDPAPDVATRGLSRVVLAELAERGLVCWRDGRPTLFAEVFRDYVRAQGGAEATEPEVSGPERPTAARVLGADGQAVVLAPLEARLYHCLESRLGAVCSRAELRALLWGAANGGSDAALDQVIRRLRHKVERDPRSPDLVVSVRGGGYRLTRSLRG